MQTRADCLPHRPDTLLVLLPGAHITPEDFWRHGFIAAVRKQKIATDILAVGTTYDQLIAHSVVDALDDEFIGPALADGYRSIWLAGISLGALIALLYAACHPQRVGGLHLLSPYPGTADICNEIHAAGSVAAWAASPAAQAGDERIAWNWLARNRTAAHPIPVSLGCGTEDRFIRNQRLFSDVIKAEHQLFVPGAHDWQTWRPLWSAWLNRCPLPRLGEAA